jgi:hypothetical protein
MVLSPGTVKRRGALPAAHTVIRFAVGIRRKLAGER